MRANRRLYCGKRRRMTSAILADWFLYVVCVDCQCNQNDTTPPGGVSYKRITCKDRLAWFAQPLDSRIDWPSFTQRTGWTSSNARKTHIFKYYLLGLWNWGANAFLDSVLMNKVVEEMISIDMSDKIARLITMIMKSTQGSLHIWWNNNYYRYEAGCEMRCQRLFSL